VQPEGLAMKKTIETIGHRTGDLSACSELPQTTAAAKYRLKPWDLFLVCSTDIFSTA
jgi:hypothetical protein